MTEETMDKKYGPLASLVDLPDLNERVREMRLFWRDMALVTSRLSEAAAQKSQPAPDPPKTVKTVMKWRVVGMGYHRDHVLAADASIALGYLESMFPNRNFDIEEVEVPADD